MSGTGHETAAGSNPPPEVLLADDPNLAYCGRLATEASRRFAEETSGRLAEEGSQASRNREAAIPKGRVSRLKDLSPEKLSTDTKLQWDASIETNYVPSKWLLEQEMMARRRWDPEQDRFLDESCFKDDGSSEDVYKIAAEQGLTGLCFSGGGIRSATFNLGVIQGLAQLGLLPFVDYLSSVSGGGYIHQFLAAWILRDRDGRAGVEKKLIPQPEAGCLPRAPEPIKWLQRYASYLTPRRGILSTDTWTMIAIWFRNTLLNQVPIVAFLAAAFFMLNLLVPGSAKHLIGFDRATGGVGVFVIIVGLAIGVFVVNSIVVLARDLRQQTDLSLAGIDSPLDQEPAAKADGNGKQENREPPPQSAASQPSPGKTGANETGANETGPEKSSPDTTSPEKAEAQLYEGLLNNRKVQLWIILPWLAMSVWAAYWQKMPLTQALWVKIAFGIVCIVVTAIVAGMVAFSGGAMDAYRHLHDKEDAKKGSAAIGFLAAAVASAIVACAMGWGFQAGSLYLANWVSQSIGTLGSASNPFLVDPWRLQIVILPALFLSVPYIAIELTLGLLGRDYADTRREWLARLRAWSMLYALVWMGLTAIAFLTPYLGFHILAIGWRAEIPAAATFVASHLTTVLAGSSGKSDGKPTSKGFLGYKPMDLVAIAAAPVAVLTFLIVLAFGTEWVACLLLESYRWLGWMLGLSGCAALSALVAWIFGWRLDINEFSMQSFYRNRLSRCYLGASLWERKPNPFTGFDMRHCIQDAPVRGQDAPPPVMNLLPDNFDRLGKPDGRYDGPFPIFCTTLNLTTGEDLASQERKGASFAFTPLYSGYSVSWTDGGKDEGVSLNGYVPTSLYAYKNGGIHLDTAVAISGAAVNPNQGYNSNPALAFLMTFFNVRLGWWISNPRKTDAWQARTNRPTPTFALHYLLRELFGMANDRSKYVNLSDGGHFENMGLYELVRRRCKYIVVCDAEEDPEMKFCGIGNAVNRCRTDFGAEIDLDLRPLQIQEGKFSQAHCVVGTIRYPPPQQKPAPSESASSDCECLGDEDDKFYEGTILYIKSSLVGDEPADLVAYKLQHETFPQDSTANQWFTETQFESYRRLGHHIALTAIRPALQPRQNKVEKRSDVAKLFECLYAVWYPPTPEMQQYLTQHVQQYQSILKELRERPELAGLAERLNDHRNALRSPVLWDPPAAPPGSADYAWQFANALLDFMYTVYADLELAFPDNRTSPHADWWICLFRRWCRVSLLRETWEKMTPVYSAEFQLFARRELKLP